MKKLFFALTILTLSFCISCEDLTCNGMGKLSVENTSIGTVQRLMVDGVNYGSVDPGETLEVELAPGEHIWQLVGLSGGTGCSPAAVIIMECETSAFSCHGK
jgi:hypothetical protein